MPCYDERNEPSYIIQTELEPLRKKVKKVEAMLCSLLSNFSDPINAIRNVDEKESGVSHKEFIQWWENHKKQDRLRKINEAKEKIRRIEDKRKRLSSLEEEVKKLKREINE